MFSLLSLIPQDSAMKLVHAERNGEAFDSQLVIGVRESYVNLSSNTSDKLQVHGHMSLLIDVYACFH